ncbi:MAG TPA: restriction endonuclease [Rubrobacteraceae bacterium]|nr:restriction endonuclease [Rubrobacteraceae bacterium]
MDAAEFEAEVSGLLRELGYTVHPAPRPGLHDVDLLLETTGHKVAVQLKRWKAPVGDGSVYALFCGRVHYGTDEAWLITTSEFTRQAARLASTTGVRLVDGIELAEWLTSRREEQLSAPDEDPKPFVQPARSSPRSSETLGSAAPEIAVQDEGEGAEGPHEAPAGHG